MTYRIRQGLLFEPFDDQGQALLFDPDKNLPYVLNQVAAFILMNMDGRSREAIAGELCMRFDVEYKRALDDIDVIYRELRQKDLIVGVE
jgi:hypothetical protein